MKTTTKQNEEIIDRLNDIFVCKYCDKKFKLNFDKDLCEDCTEIYDEANALFPLIFPTICECCGKKTILKSTYKGWRCPDCY